MVQIILVAEYSCKVVTCSTLCEC